MDGSIVITTFPTRSASKFVLDLVGARFLTNSPMLSVEGLTGCKLKQTTHRKHFCCDRREELTTEIDTRFLEELDRSGFIDGLYK